MTIRDKCRVCNYTRPHTATTMSCCGMVMQKQPDDEWTPEIIAGFNSALNDPETGKRYQGNDGPWRNGLVKEVIDVRKRRVK